jgi:YhcH/YjgK/YiaL family protein
VILDRLYDAELYFGLGPRFRKALLALPELSRHDSGRYELEGKDLYANVQTYQSKPRAEGRWEAHRKYTDVQYIVEGSEVMGCANLRDMDITEPYDAEKDFMLLKGEGSFFTVKAGMFAIFSPHDVHMPNLAETAPALVKKIVVKIAV